MLIRVKVPYRGSGADVGVTADSAALWRGTPGAARLQHHTLFSFLTVHNRWSRFPARAWNTAASYTDLGECCAGPNDTHTQHTHTSTEGVAVSMSGLSLTHMLLPFWVQQSQLFLSVLWVCLSLQVIHELICSRPTVQIPPRMISWFYCREVRVQTKEG